MRRRGLVVMTLLGALTAIAVTATTVSADVAPGAPAVDARALVELAQCHAPGTAMEVAPAGAGATVVSFDVPNETRVRLDATGDVAAASTNTGCHPRAVDTVLVVGTDRGDRPASPAELAHVLARFQSGDWREPGVWHAAD